MYSLERVAETPQARAVGTDQVVDHENFAGISRGTGGWTVDPDPAEVLRDHVAWTDRVAGRIEGDPVRPVAQDLRSVGCHADHVVRSDIAGRQARDVNAVSMIRSNRVAKCCAAAADLVLRAILDQDAVAAVTGVSGSELVSSPGATPM